MTKKTNHGKTRKDKGIKHAIKVRTAINAAYRKGVRIGEANRCNHCVSKKLRLMQIANSNLWDIMTELDRTDPIEGVVLSFDMADKVINALRKGEMHVKYANIIERQVCEADKTFHLLLDELLAGDDSPAA